MLKRAFFDVFLAFKPFGNCFKSHRCSSVHRRSSSEPGGGTPCQDWLEEAMECNTHACEEGARDCQLGAWSGWTSCQQGPMRFRYRRIEQQPANAGVPCAGALREAASCMSKVDCETSEWTTWDECDKTCGGFGSRRFRPFGSQVDSR